MRKPFKIGDEVALSATFLRSMGTLNFGQSSIGSAGVSTHDAGIGKIEEIIDGWLARVRFPGGDRTLNLLNLVHREHIHLEAMRAEHNPDKPRITHDLFSPWDY